MYIGFLIVSFLIYIRSINIHLTIIRVALNLSATYIRIMYTCMYCASARPNACVRCSMVGSAHVSRTVTECVECIYTASGFNRIYVFFLDLGRETTSLPNCHCTVTRSCRDGLLGHQLPNINGHKAQDTHGPHPAQETSARGNDCETTSVDSVPSCGKCSMQVESMVAPSPAKPQFVWHCTPSVGIFC